MTGNRQDFEVIQGGCPSGASVERIALSLVHPRGHVHIPISAILRIEASGEVVFAGERGWPVSFPIPHVEIWVTPPIREQIHCLTREIVDQTVAIFVAGQCIMSPMIREPLCGAGSSFQLSANDLAEAQTLAERLRTGWRAAGPRLVP